MIYEGPQKGHSWMETVIKSGGHFLKQAMPLVEVCFHRGDRIGCLEDRRTAKFLLSGKSVG
ncbi:MAG: hypothetical protein DRH37_00935 [Deltaproteobacteria bacterium]|nr:MAG: hypothetical protein DRH37_00935 [Deltaproteobacteria bacterium]